MQITDVRIRKVEKEGKMKAVEMCIRDSANTDKMYMNRFFKI